MSTLVDYDFGPAARKRLHEAGDPRPDGAVACLDASASDVSMATSSRPTR